MHFGKIVLSPAGDGQYCSRILHCLIGIECRVARSRDPRQSEWKCGIFARGERGGEVATGLRDRDPQCCFKILVAPVGRYRLSCKTKSVEMIDRVAQRLFQRWSGTARAGNAGEEDHHKRWQLARYCMVGLSTTRWSSGHLDIPRRQCRRALGHAIDGVVAFHQNLPAQRTPAAWGMWKTSRMRVAQSGASSLGSFEETCE
jgi:hypothetical protein